MSIYGLLLENNINLSDLKIEDNPSKEFVQSHINDMDCIKDFLKDSVRKNSCMFIDIKTNKVICLFMVFNDRGHHILNNLEVSTKYRRKGLGRQALDYAVKKKHADHLWVYENNKIAINLYLSYGFEFTGDEYIEDGKKRLYMSLKRSSD